MDWARPLRDAGGRRAAREPAVERVLGPGDDAAAEPVPRALVDGRARTFWVRGADSPLTLVDADEPIAAHPLRARLRDLLAAHEHGHPASSRTPGNPAFSEALFVELVRGEQYARAFSLLAPDCQRRWGGVERFAAAHREGSPSPLGGVSVVAVRHLDEWVDPRRGERHRGVAELDVEYTFGAAERHMVLRRTVHLVSVEGHWRSLCYPVEGDAALAGAAAA